MRIHQILVIIKSDLKLGHSLKGVDTTDQGNGKAHLAVTTHFQPTNSIPSFFSPNPKKSNPNYHRLSTYIGTLNNSLQIFL
jgi:hypothetical protein